MKVIASLIVILSVSISFAEDGHIPPPATEDLGYGLKGGYYQVIINLPGLHLKKDTHIRADEIILKAPIVTNGFQLHLDARRIRFESGGIIQAFTEAAVTETAGGRSGSKGPKGCDQCRDPIPQWPIFAKWGGHGGRGENGEPGPNGAPGHQNPSPVLLFAAEIIGTPMIDATGQKGGQGGYGGRGGAGGDGGKGQKGKASCIFGDAWSAGGGGDSGPGGQGGRGGNGGTGGNAVPVIFLSAKPLESMSLAAVISGPGEGGNPGAGGDPGAYGSAGEGGDGDSANCILWVEEEGRGPGGSVDTTHPGNSVAGNAGPRGDSAPSDHPWVRGFRHSSADRWPNLTTGDYSDWEKTRKEIFRTWFDFHWARALNIFVRHSIILVSNINKSREDILGSSDQMDMTLEEIVRDTNREAAAAVLAHWRNHFIEPLERSGVVAGSPATLLPALEMAKALESGLRGIEEATDLAKVRSDLSKSLIQADAILETGLDVAIESCKPYVQQQKSLDRHFGVTQHFVIPACLGVPDFRDHKNIEKQIVLINPYRAVAPDNVELNLIKPAPIEQALMRMQPGLKSPEKWLFALLKDAISIPLAFAQDDLDVIYVDHREISVARVLQSRPMSNTAPMIDSGGMLTGFGIDNVSNVNRNNLAVHLRVLSLLGGAKQ